MNGQLTEKERARFFCLLSFHAFLFPCKPIPHLHPLYLVLHTCAVSHRHFILSKWRRAPARILLVILQSLLFLQGDPRHSWWGSLPAPSWHASVAGGSGTCGCLAGGCGGVARCCFVWAGLRLASLLNLLHSHMCTDSVGTPVDFRMTTQSPTTQTPLTAYKGRVLFWVS